MYKRLVNAGTISLASLAISQLIRFFSNLWLARLLMPEAFGLVAVVNMVLMGIALFSDIGLRQVIIQKDGDLTPEFLNTIWVVQILRGVGLFAIALAVAGILMWLQTMGAVTVNTYADPLLPFLVAGASLSSIFGGLASTKLDTNYRAMALGRVVGTDLFAQVCATGVMIAVALATKSPWALVLGGVTAALVRCVLSHSFLTGEKNALYFDKTIASSILRRGRWILLSSPLTFLELNGAVLLLGGLMDSASLGVYLIASLFVGVVQLISQNLASNVFFPGLCAAARIGTTDLRRVYLRYQLVADAIIVTLAGGLMGGGRAVIDLLFDHRYESAGGLLSSLAVGLVAVRYTVIEQLANAKGDFKLGPPTIFCRIAAMAIGIVAGHHYAGLQGAALGVAFSWFAGWPILLWYRSKSISSVWRSDAIAAVFLAGGYGLGILFAEIVHRFHLHLAR